MIRDDEAGLVAWLAAGSRVLRPVLADGRDLRAVPLGERFDSERHGRANRLDVWRGCGILKVAPGAPVLAYTGTARLVVADLDVADRRLARVGVAVTVERSGGVDAPTSPPVMSAST